MRGYILRRPVGICSILSKLGKSGRPAQDSIVYEINYSNYHIRITCSKGRIVSIPATETEFESVANIIK